MKKSAIAPLVLAGGLVLSVHTSALAASPNAIVQTGVQYIGKPYVFGALVGDLNEFDCSSFTATIFKQNGILLPRVAADQAKVGIAVNKSDLQVGDLVFFDTSFTGVIDHVGIYIGNNQMINAIISGVKIVNMNTTYWTSRYVTARRVLNTPTSLEQLTQSSNTSVQVTPIPNATPTLTTASTPTASPSVHTVQSGDSLWLISQTYGLSVAELKSLNNLTSDVIFPGEELKVSNQKTPVAPKTVKSGNSTSNGNAQPVVTQVAGSKTSNTYKVNSGDTLSKIALNFNLTAAQLKSLNGLKSDVIFPGQSLTVKKSPSTVAPKTTVVPNEPTTSSQKAKEPVVTTETQTKTITYTVQKGDTLSAIAYKESVSLSDLMAFNHLTSYMIYPGQKLKINQTSVSSTQTQVKIAAVTTPAPTPITYTVKKGDTLWDIAVLNNTNTKKLMKANNLMSPFIFPGQKINLI